MTRPNKRMHTSRRPALQFHCSGFFGRWIRNQRPVPAAVDDPCRSAFNKAHIAMKTPFRLRSAIRKRLPWFLIDLGICGKGDDCEKHGGSHEWYNQDNVHSACYHCCVVRSGLVPSKAASDAIHISVASVHGTDFLVTWNLRHVSNPYIRSPLRQAVERHAATDGHGSRHPLCLRGSEV